MKRLLILLTFLSISFGGFASHILGGTITWKCLPNGQFVFYMEVYRDCTGIQFNYQNETLDVVGSPLPANSQGQPVSSIILIPDLNRFNVNNGEISPRCDTTTGSTYSCSKGQQGTFQAFYFKSSPVTLSGTPPSSGWQFFWQAPCCRPVDISNVNIATGVAINRMLLRATMYSNSGVQSMNPCFDSSPEFTSSPLAMVNRGFSSTYNNSGMDPEDDSLVYTWDRAYDGPINNPDTLIFKPGYSASSPFPDGSFNSLNKRAMLDANSGIVEFGVFSGRGIHKYLTVVKIDAFRNRSLLSTTYREVPTSIFDIPLLPDMRQNLPPNYILNRKDTNRIDITVVGGQLVEIPLSIIDTNLLSTQLLTMTMNGSHFSQDLTSTGTCQNFSNSNCAYLDNSILLPDTVLGVPTYKIESAGQINTTFKWQTDCSLLGPNGQDKTYYFYFDAHDNFCPIPASRAAVIAVTVTNSETTFLPKLECVKSSILGTDIYWNQSVYNSINKFQNLEIYKASDRNGSYTRLTTITDTTTIGFQDLAAPSSDFYYLKVNGTSCSNQPQSIYSDTLTDPDNKLSVSNIPSCFKLSWNAQDRSYRTKYLIYREYPLGSGFKLIDSTYNASEYCDPFTACADSVNYYVSIENGGNCSFDFSAGKATGNNALMNNGIREINHVLTANVSYGRFQWYDCNKQSIILDETSQMFVPKDTGIYAVILYQYGCVDTSNCILYSPVGLPENSFQSQLNYYPNPTNGLVQIDFKQVQQNVAVEVYSIQGKLVQTQQFNNGERFELNLDQPAGIYFIQLTNEKGERANLKVVKQ